MQCFTNNLYYGYTTRRTIYTVFTEVRSCMPAYECVVYKCFCLCYSLLLDKRFLLYYIHIRFEHSDLCNSESEYTNVKWFEKCGSTMENMSKPHVCNVTETMRPTLIESVKLYYGHRLAVRNALVDCKWIFMEASNIIEQYLFFDGESTIRVWFEGPFNDDRFEYSIPMKQIPFLENFGFPLRRVMYNDQYLQK